MSAREPRLSVVKENVEGRLQIEQLQSRTRRNHFGRPSHRCFGLLFSSLFLGKKNSKNIQVQSKCYLFGSAAFVEAAAITENCFWKPILITVILTKRSIPRLKAQVLVGDFRIQYTGHQFVRSLWLLKRPASFLCRHLAVCLAGSSVHLSNSPQSTKPNGACFQHCTMAIIVSANWGDALYAKGHWIESNGFKT